MIEAAEVAALAAEVTGLPRVEPNVDFEDYGMDSLALLHLADLLDARAGIACDVEHLGTARNAAELADLLNAEAS